MLLTFPQAPHGHPGSSAHGIATTSLILSSRADYSEAGTHTPPAIRIQGTKGEIQVDGPAFRPTKWRVLWGPEAEKDGKKGTEEYEEKIPGHGMFWEADEAARGVRDGKGESEGLTWEESVVIMEVMDEVRKQGGIEYPEAIETTKYPVDLPGA